VFKRHHADTPAEAFDREDAEAFARRYDWAVSVLKTCFARAERQGAIDRSPFADLQRRRTPGRRDLDPLTVEEVDRLGQAALEVHGWYGPRMRALILFAAYTGVRPGELVALEWRDVDLSNGLEVRRRLYQGRLDYPKTGPRMVALVPHARDALTGLPRDSELVFSSKRGRRLSSGSLRSWYWQPVWGRFGRKVDLYELRHFCGHYLYVVCDLPSRVVAAQLGHSSPRKVEELYGHFKVGALEEIDRAFGANVAPLRSIEKAS
jgi:integrase